MPNHPQGNGRNVALPDENRPSWRPQDESGHRNRRPMYDEDDDDDRYMRGRGYWEDREARDWDRDERWRSERYGRYPGAFEDHYRGRGERIGVPHGYDHDRERMNLGTGGTYASGYSQGGQSAGYQGPGMMHASSGQHAMQAQYGSQGYQGGGHRGKGPASYQRSDERIRELVCEALTDDDRVDATHIDVTVKSGEVILTGTVDDRQQKRLAEDCVEQVAGVQDVQNQLRVGGDKLHQRMDDERRHRS